MPTVGCAIHYARVVAHKVEFNWFDKSRVTHYPTHKKSPRCGLFLNDSSCLTQLFFDTGRFAFQSTQVVQLGATDITTAFYLDGVNQLAVSLENTLNTCAV